MTGAGRGIGRGIALRLARDGHAVAVNDVNKAGAEAVAAEITEAGGRAIAVPADVTDRDAVFAMVDRVATELGSVDVMVANAGIAQVKTLLEVTPEDLADDLRGERLRRRLLPAGRRREDDRTGHRR